MTGPLPPGIHRAIPADRYHADPCERPSLTATLIKILCDKSPLHAWNAHPELNPDHVREESSTFDVGTVAHAMLLEGRDRDVCVPVDAADWRTKAAKEQRDEIRASGRIPLLTDQYLRLIDMVEAVQHELDLHTADPPVLKDGRPEQTLVWEEPGGVIIRGRVDWLRTDLVAFDDLKTTSRSADPRLWADRRMWDFGLDIQAALYQRGLHILTGKTPEPRFVIVESVPPYAVSVLGLAPSALELAREKVEWAIDVWRECTQRDEWPGFTRRVAYAESPSYAVTRWAETRWLDEQETSP